MHNTAMIKALATLVLLPILVLAAESPRNGQIRAKPNVVAWDQAAGAWVSPVAFWKSHAEQRGGLTWGERSSYPPYGQVKEHDTFIIQLSTGPCLMEFFHSRWRRANDVRRWDPRFNEYGGCPNVFD
ncbi:MAG: hypothetical protein ACR2PZ_27310 [Pseudomonadales bacterium]